MLEVDGLVVRYGRVEAIRGISLSVRDGEAVAVVGPNGAGKTTLLSAIMGRIRATAGSISFQGKALTRLPPEKIVRLGIGLVPEGRHIFTTLTVEENLKLGAMAAGHGADNISQWMTRFPVLATYRHVPAGKLSGGEQQQLAIARAMAARPRILLLDEPSLGLAPLVVDDVFRLLEEFRAASTSILLVEQNATRAVAFADRTYVVKSGEVVLEGARDEMRNSRAHMTSAYLGG